MRTADIQDLSSSATQLLVSIDDDEADIWQRTSPAHRELCSARLIEYVGGRWNVTARGADLTVKLAAR